MTIRFFTNLVCLNAFVDVPVVGKRVMTDRRRRNLVALSNHITYMFQHVSNCMTAYEIEIRSVVAP